ncbi:MAG: hypothetical protein QOI37_1764 [Chloroflexota bacterium]|nr:hypothetical protein [Chloroflexota bacterium]
MRRVIAAILLIALLAAGGGLIATTAYQAGLTTAITTHSVDGTTVVTPVVPPPYAYGYGYGYGGHPFGFGIFGLFGTLLFVSIVFALLRAIVFRGGPGRHGSWGPRGWGGYGRDRDPGDHGHQGAAPWEARARQTFDRWHEGAHDASTRSGPSDPVPPTGAP